MKKIRGKAIGTLRVGMAAGVWAVLFFVGIQADVSAKSLFQTLPDSKVDQALKSKARQVAADLLTRWRDGKFEPLADDFTLDLSVRLPPADQEKACNRLRALFGDFRSLVFIEAVASPGLPGYVMFRFKGTFSGAKANPEIRVLMNDEAKVTGFWVKHWQDEVN